MLGLGCLTGFILAFAVTIFCIQAGKEPALHLGLVDRPNARKHHTGIIPLIGGIAMFVGFSIGLLVLPDSLSAHYGLLAAMFILLIVGVKDDYHELTAPIRFAAQGIAALVIVFAGEKVLFDLGPLLGQGNIELGSWAVPFTVFCVIGVINALNMSDGLDGLAGGQSLNTLIWLFVLVLIAGVESASFAPAIVLGAALAAFLCFNLRHAWRKRASVFMGDGGSMILGLALVWFFIDLSQGSERVMAPITAVWLLALPLLDTVSIMIQRVLNGRSPFSPDRDHLHHILIEAGFSDTKTTAILLTASFLCGAVGVVAYLIGIPDTVMLFAFLSLFAIYFYCLMSRRSSVRRLAQRTKLQASLE